MACLMHVINEKRPDMFKELVKKDRSYRGYDENYRVSREEILELVDLTRYTPSAVNRQPLKYYIATDREEVVNIQSMTRWAKSLKNVTLPHEGKGPTGFIVICVDTGICPNIAACLMDVGIVAHTMLLGAVEKGLGGCMIGNFKKREVIHGLNLDKKLEPILIIAVGRPDEKIILTNVGEDGKTTYYRDENDVHYVPKRILKDIIIN